MSRTATQPVTFNPPRAGGLCAQAWELFAEGADKGTPVTSAMLPDLALATSQNLTNLRIELSRYNRWMAKNAPHIAS